MRLPCVLVDLQPDNMARVFVHRKTRQTPHRKNLRRLGRGARSPCSRQCTRVHRQRPAGYLRRPFLGRRSQSQPAVVVNGGTNKGSFDRTKMWDKQQSMTIRSVIILIQRGD